MPGLREETEEGQGAWDCRGSVLDCNRYMLDHEVATDVTFLVGEAREVVRAHQYMLISRTPVFHAMFRGPLATRDSVDVPDIDLDTFRSMLRFLYCEEVDLTADTVMAVLYAGKKYGLPGLVKHCVQFLETALDLDTMFVILEQAHQFDETELRATVLRYAMENAEHVLAALEFTDLCHQCVDDIISCDQLRAREESVLRAAVRWGEKQCLKQGLQISDENLRLTLGPSLYHIRFPTMNMLSFTQLYAASRLLTDAEKVKILSHHINPAMPVEPFKSRKREFKELMHLTRFPATNPTKWDCLKGSDAICFSVDKAISLCGFTIYGAFQSPSTGTQLDVGYVILGPQEETLGKGKQVVTSREDNKQYDVMFDQPVPVEPEAVYTVQCYIRGEKTYNGTAGKERVERSGVLFIIASSDRSSTGTDVHRGQIPGFIFTLS